MASNLRQGRSGDPETYGPPEYPSQRTPRVAPENKMCVYYPGGYKAQYLFVRTSVCQFGCLSSTIYVCICVVCLCVRLSVRHPCILAIFSINGQTNNHPDCPGEKERIKKERMVAEDQREHSIESR